MSRAHEIYPLHRQLAKDLENIKSDPCNYQILEKYYNARIAEGISVARIYKCINTLKILSKMFGKSFENATKGDIVELVARFEKLDLSDWTKRDYKIILKHFYRWLRNSDGDTPEEVRWIRKINAPKSRYPIMPQDLLTPEEKLAMSKAAQNPRDRAMIEAFSESGRRPGEILTVHIRDVEFDGAGAKLHVNGKVGEDFVRLISSAPSLASWLNYHPLRDNPDAPVWIGLGKKNYLKQLSHAAASAVLRRLGKRAGIHKRRLHYYLCRYSRIDETQGILTESYQCMMFGWRFGSKMPGTYMKRYGKHIDDAQAIMNGLAPPKKQAVVMQPPKLCARCKLQNSGVSKFCNRCGSPLDIQTMVHVDDRNTMAESVLDKLTKNPEILEKLKALLRD